MNVIIWHNKPKEDLSAMDLRAVAAQMDREGREYEVYALARTRPGERSLYEYCGELLFIPSAGRAGVCLNADSDWTDAGSAQEALDLYNAGEMVN